VNFIFPPGFDFLDLRPKTRVPTVTASSGTLTSVTGQTSRYFVIGKLVVETFQFTITTNGSGAGALNVSTAFPIKTNTAGVGRENNALGPVAMIGFAGGSSITITRMDNGYPGADGRLFFGTLAYEID
jgi:hypothetical protein